MKTIEYAHLQTLACANGVDESNAIAIMAAIVSGVVGRRNTLMEFAGPIRLDPMGLALVDDDGVGSDLVERLLSPARALQETLLKRFHRIDQNLLKEVLIGQKYGVHFRDVLEEHRNTLFGTGSHTNPRHEMDLNLDIGGRAIDPLSVDLIDRLDLVIRPRFLIESPTVRNLQAAVTSLHMASGFLWGGHKFSCR